MSYSHAQKIIAEEKPDPRLADVKVGEIWVLEIGAWGPFAAIVHEVSGELLMFPEPINAYFKIFHPHKPESYLKSARRIWPESPRLAGSDHE
jgi:hypothetical protein